MLQVYKFFVNKNPNYNIMKQINFITDLREVHKQLGNDIRLSEVSLKLINNMIIDLARRIVFLSIKIAQYSETNVISWKDIKFGTNIVLSGEVIKHAISSGDKILQKYNKIETTNEKNTNIKDSAIGLVFKSSKCKHIISEFIVKRNTISHRACIYLAAIIEYIAAEILEISSNAAKDNRNGTLFLKHIYLAVRNDEELSHSFMGYIIGSPNILSIKDDSDKYIIQEPFGKKFFTDASIKRILYKAGVKYISKDVYIKVRSLIYDFVKNILTVIFNIQLKNNKKIITYEDGLMALKTMHISFYTSDNFGTKGNCRRSINVLDLESKTKRKTRRKPRTNIPKLIQKYTKTECAILPHSSVKRIIKEIGFEIRSSRKYTIKMTDQFVWLVHGILEQYLIGILGVSYSVTIHSRTKLEPKDIGIILAITHNGFNF